MPGRELLIVELPVEQRKTGRCGGDEAHEGEGLWTADVIAGMAFSTKGFGAVFADAAFGGGCAGAGWARQGG